MQRLQPPTSGADPGAADGELLTDQCIDSAVRDACDLGYLVTTVTDACATLSQERHDWSLRNNRGYCRQVTTAEIVAEVGRLTGVAAVAG